MVTENNVSTSYALAIDHVVIAVADLDQAIEQFILAGFQVERGGINGPTHNALIFFSDGKYIELICLRTKFIRMLFKLRSMLKALGLLRQDDQQLRTRFMQWFDGGNGLLDWCLRCEDIQGVIDKLNREGHLCTQVEVFQRERPDGMVAQWKLAATSSRGLPFLIDDISPVAIRVPFKQHCEHKNGVIGFSRLMVNRNFINVSPEKVQSYFSLLRSQTHFSTQVCLVEGDAPPLVLELASTGASRGAIEGFAGVHIV